MSEQGSVSNTRDLSLIKSILSSDGKTDDGQYSSDFYDDKSNENESVGPSEKHQTLSVLREPPQKVVLHLDDVKEKKKHTKKRTRPKKVTQPLEVVDNEMLLQEKYSELYILLQDQFEAQKGKISEDMRILQRQATKACKQAAVRPPSGRPPAVRRPIQTMITPTNSDGLQDADDQDSIILIDTTEGNKGTTKLVSFTDANTVLNSNPASAHMRNGNRGRNRIRSATTRPNKPTTITKRPQSACNKTSPNSSTPLIGNRSRSTSNEFDRKGSWRNRKSSRSSSVSSSSVSRSRSRSRSRERSNFQLKTTDNPALLEWLKKKNKLLRKQKIEDKKRRREERKKKMSEEKKQLENQEKSEKKVRQWMLHKRKEERLLKQRARMDKKQAVNIDDNKLVTEETIDLQNPEKGATESQERTTSQNNAQGIEKRKEEHKECKCGMVDTLKLKEELERQKRMLERQRVTSARLAKKLSDSQNPTNSKTRGQSPSKNKPMNTDDSVSEQNRRSYDQWLKTKRGDEEERRKLEKEVERRKMADSDQIVSDVAKSRIDNIRRGKKNIDSGVTEIDEAASLRPIGKDGTTSPPRPQSAQPVTSGPQPSVKQRPASAKTVAKKTLSLSYPAPSKKRSKSPPKPTGKPSKPYKDIKHQQNSWDEFSDHIWEKLNGEEDDADKADESQRPEPQGSESPSDNQVDSAGSEMGGNPLDEAISEDSVSGSATLTTEEEPEEDVQEDQEDNADVEGGREDADVEGGREDADVERGREDADVEGGREDADDEGGREDADVEGGREDADVEGSREDAVDEGGCEDTEDNEESEAHVEDTTGQTRERDGTIEDEIAETPAATETADDVASQMLESADDTEEQHGDEGDQTDRSKKEAKHVHFAEKPVEIEPADEEEGDGKEPVKTDDGEDEIPDADANETPDGTEVVEADPPSVDSVSNDTTTTDGGIIVGESFCEEKEDGNVFLTESTT